MAQGEHTRALVPALLQLRHCRRRVLREQLQVAGRAAGRGAVAEQDVDAVAPRHLHESRDALIELGIVDDVAEHDQISVRALAEQVAGRGRNLDAVEGGVQWVDARVFGMEVQNRTAQSADRRGEINDQGIMTALQEITGVLNVPRTTGAAVPANSTTVSAAQETQSQPRAFRSYYDDEAYGANIQLGLAVTVVMGRHLSPAERPMVVLTPTKEDMDAYAKALRTVKTCVGSEWCRMGTQDSTQMGKDLERAMWRMYAPHKVKFAVSGCPRNCAEAGIKDVGIIGVDSGWEMYVAGNGGIKTEVAHFFTKLKTAAEVLEYTGAFCELYRQEGWYLERTVHFVNRVGLDYVKKRILEDADGRKALWEQLQFALDGEPDPWFEMEKAAVDTRQFDAIVA